MTETVLWRLEEVGKWLYKIGDKYKRKQTQELVWGGSGEYYILG